MSDAVALGVPLLILLVTVWVVVSYRNKRMRALQTALQPWQLEEHPDDRGNMVVYATHPGDRPQVIGSVPWNDENFEYLIEEERAKGRVRLAALNRGRLEALVRSGSSS